MELNYVLHIQRMEEEMFKQGKSKPLGVHSTFKDTYWKAGMT